MLIACSKCFNAILQKVVELLNKSAYIQTAITGRHFCGATYDSLCLIFRHS